MLYYETNEEGNYQYTTEIMEVIKINKDTSKITEKELIQIIKDKDNNRYAIQEIYEIEI